MKIERIAAALTAVNLTLLLAALAQARPIGEQATSPLLRTQVLEVVDQHGTVRARVKAESDGEVVFRLFDQAGTIRVKLGASKDGSGVILVNDATEPGVHVLANAKGTSLKLRNKDGRERVITP